MPQVVLDCIIRALHQHSGVQIKFEILVGLEISDLNVDVLSDHIATFYQILLDLALGAAPLADRLHNIGRDSLRQAHLRRGGKGA